MINKQTEIKPTSSFDRVKWVFIVVLIAAGIWANYNYGQVAWALRLAGWIILACLLLAVASQTRAGRAVWRFAKEARLELHKVVWPTRPETVQTTMIVIAMVVLMSLILWGLDTVLLWVVSLLTGHKG